MNANDSTTKQEASAQYEEIALRAYHLWQERGSPIGSPEEDWLRAEQEICGQGAQPTGPAPDLVSQAQAATV
jgi:hypothetical protein